MKYTNINCEACGIVFREEDEVVVCPVCGAPHHRACWKANGHCAHESRHGDGYVWIAPQTAGNEKDGTTDAPTIRKPDVSEGETLENGEEIVLCPRCGSRNYQNDAFCLRCGQTLHPEDNKENVNRIRNTFFSDDEQTERGNSVQFTDEMLNNLRIYGGLHPASTLDGIPVCEYSDYVGGGSPGKILRRLSTMERYGKRLSFHLPAFLFGPVWFLFRKMRKEGWIVGMAMVLLLLFSGLLQINDAFSTYTKQTYALLPAILSGEISQNEALERMNALMEQYTNAELSKSERLRDAVGEVLYYTALLGVPLYSGVFGLDRYRKRAKAEIHRIRKECGDMQSYQQQLIREGGTSAGGAFAGVLLIVIGIVCNFYVPVLLSLLYF